MDDNIFFGVKRKIDRKINLYFYCLDCALKKFAMIDKEISTLLKKLIYIKKCYCIVWTHRLKFKKYRK